MKEYRWMGSLRLTFVQPDGTERTIENVEPGQSLMELARENGVDGILGDCDGGCSCATCHVYVDPGWLKVVGPPDDIESLTLAMESDVQRDNSRLSCQIEVQPELDGLRVTVATSDGT
jgi:2Fe-2S ferredoxin